MIIWTDDDHEAPDGPLYDTPIDAFERCLYDDLATLEKQALDSTDLATVRKLWRVFGTLDAHVQRIEAAIGRRVDRLME